jgi:hypothetical protein
VAGIRNKRPDVLCVFVNVYNVHIRFK